MEHTNHPFRKENDLPNPYDYVPMLIFQGVAIQVSSFSLLSSMWQTLKLGHTIAEQLPPRRPQMSACISIMVVQKVRQVLVKRCETHRFTLGFPPWFFGFPTRFRLLKKIHHVFFLRPFLSSNKMWGRFSPLNIPMTWEIWVGTNFAVSHGTRAKAQQPWILLKKLRLFKHPNDRSHSVSGFWLQISETNWETWCWSAKVDRRDDFWKPAPKIEKDEQIKTWHPTTCRSGQWFPTVPKTQLLHGMGSFTFPLEGVRK